MKKALLILSFIALAWACDKHDNDYKKNVPSDGYPFSYVKNMYPGYKLCQADHFVQGYMSVSSVKIDRNIKTFKSRFHLRFSLEGDIVKGGNMKGDPCDEGFEQLAQKYDDVYGPHDVLCGADMERGVIMTADKMEYYVYLAKGDYPLDKDGTLLLDSYVEYDFCTRSHQSLLIKRPSQSDTDVAVDWSVIQVTETQMFLNDFNSSEYEDTGVTLIDVKNHLFNIILPEESGVYSLRFVAKKDGKVIHDEIIEDIELPAYQHPFPY